MAVKQLKNMQEQFRRSVSGSGVRNSEPPPLPEDSAVEAYLAEKGRGKALSEPAHRAAGEVVELPLSAVEDNPANARAFYPEDAMRALMALIERDGQLEPAHVYPSTKPGVFVLLAGHRRKRALVRLGKQTIKAFVGSPPASEFEAYRKSWAHNEADKLTDFDYAVKWDWLLREGVVESQAEIARLLGISKARVSKIFQLGKLPPAILDRMGNNPDPELLGSRNSYLVASLWSETQDEALTAKLLDAIYSEQLTTREAEAYAARLVKHDGAAQPRTRARVLSRSVMRGPGKGVLRVYEKKVDFSLSELSEERRDVVVAKILEALQRVGFSTGIQPPEAGSDAGV